MHRNGLDDDNSVIFANDSYTLTFDDYAGVWVVSDLHQTAFFQSTTLAHLYTPVGSGHGNLTVSHDPIWPWDMTGAGNQTVLNAYQQIDDEDATRYARYCFQVAHFHTDRYEAEMRALATHDAFELLKNHSTAAPHLVLSGWLAESATPQNMGVIDAIRVTGDLLYKSVVNVALTNLYAT